MGYFNYLIKCIIRKFVNLLFKPKVLIIFLILIFLLFALQISSRAEWSSDEKTTILNYLNSMNSHVSSLHYGLDNLYGMIDADNTIIINLLKSIERCQLNIQDCILSIEASTEGIFDYTESIYSIQGDILFVEMEIRNGLNNIYNELSANTDMLEEILAVDTEIRNALNNIYNEIHDINVFLQQTLTELNNIDTSIQQGNQLQEEQNDFMQQETQDSSVDINGFNNIESNDITSSGLSGVFTTIYNSITSWSSKDINLPIPYTNKNIIIPANYTNNMLSSVGGGWIITFISAIYYFVVARFIIYSITGIINSIKSGSILETDSKDNITTDML